MCGGMGGLTTLKDGDDGRGMDIDRVKGPIVVVCILWAAILSTLFLFLFFSSGKQRREEEAAATSDLALTRSEVQ